MGEDVTRLRKLRVDLRPHVDGATDQPLLRAACPPRAADSAAARVHGIKCLRPGNKGNFFPCLLITWGVRLASKCQRASTFSCYLLMVPVHSRKLTSLYRGVGGGPRHGPQPLRHPLVRLKLDDAAGLS